MDFKIRAAKREDCKEISRMIIELAVFEKMQDQLKISTQDADQKLVLVYDLWARLYWPVAFLEALRTSEGGSHLKQGSRFSASTVG
ncbi:unnamed protein product [Boreogadus saida]